MLDATLGFVTPMMSAADRLLGNQKHSGGKSKIDSSSKDFESLMLGSWLQQAEESFAKVPGTDDEEDESGGSEMQGIAMQAMGTALAQSGGIGLAKMLTAHLRTESESDARTPSTQN